jgi:microcystin-dependent protein
MKKMSCPQAVLAAALLTGLGGTSAQACSPESYLGSVCMTAATFCPRGYFEAQGQLISIAQNSALFALLGTTYGGNGQTTFALPDLRGRAAVGIGQGPGLLRNVQQGEASGQEQVTLTQLQMPPHSHTAQLRGTASTGNTDSPAGAAPARLPRSNVYSNAGADTAMAASTITVGTTGSGQPVDVRNPYLGMRYCIAAQGIFPPRN